MSTFTQRVIAVVEAIEPGEVMTYGQVAEAAGSPNAYLATGNAIASVGGADGFPWWRVVRNDGTFPAYGDVENSTPAWVAKKLAAEGIAFSDDGRVAGFEGQSGGSGGTRAKGQPAREAEPCWRHLDIGVQHSCRECGR